MSIELQPGMDARRRGSERRERSASDPAGLIVARITWRARLVSVVLGLAAVAGACDKPTDPSPPSAVRITCPAPVSLVSVDGGPVLGTYGDTAVTGGRTPYLTTCAPVSGSYRFPVGTTTVTCTTTDAAKQTDSCSFLVTVTAPTSRLSLTKFVAFGDSITAGEDGTNPSLFPLPTIIVATPYPQGLALQLLSRYPTEASAITVMNRGNPGEQASSPDALIRFSTVVLNDSIGYQAVLLLEGANDLRVKSSVVTQGALTNLRAMIRAAKGRGIRPYLATLPPQGPTGPRGDGAPYVVDFNVELRALAASEGVTVVDLYAAFGSATTGLIAADGLHPTQAGYLKAADAFFQTIRTTLETDPGRTTLGALDRFGQLLPTR